MIIIISFQDLLIALTGAHFVQGRKVGQESWLFMMPLDQCQCNDVREFQNFDCLPPFPSKEEKLGKKRQISENDRHMLFLVGWNIGLVPEEW